MDHQLQLNQSHSPRVQVQLNDELGNNVSPQEGVPQFQFEGEDNPFSFYNNENQRQPTSSDDQGFDHSQHHQENAQHKSDLPKEPESQIQSLMKNMQIGENLNKKEPIKLLQSSKAVQNVGKFQENSKSNIVSPSLNQYKQASFTLPTSKNQTKQTANKVDKVVSSGQKAYKEQLFNQMQELKKNFGTKESKKKTKIFEEKKEEKFIINKTFTSGSKKNKNDNDMQFQEMRMLVKMAFEKKKANYQMLKQWDRKRAENMALHGKMIELLQNEVDTRIKSSLQNFEYYQIFFRQKVKQQQKYASSPVINTRYALQSNSLSKNVYINCSVILNSLCDENTQRCKKINDFIQLIRQNILKELTDNHLNSSQRQLLKVREKISTLKSALKKQNIQTQQKANELANLFTEQSNNITNKTDKDFYRTQLSFLRKALQQIQLQRKLGQYCLEYYHTAIQEELKRSQVIREAMLTYSKGLKQAYNIGLQLQCPQIEQLSKHEQIKLIEQFYSLQQMFDSRTIELFKIKNSISSSNDITIDSFTKFINNFDYHPFDSRIILLKEFQVKHIVKTKETQEENCYLVITVDNFLHLFMNHSKEKCGKPDVTLKIANKFLQLKSGKDQTLQIIKKEERRASMMSYFWDNKVDKVYKIRFAKKDNKEEFMDYISKLMVDHF